jgi:nitrite reductase/ring-hydroxylating ferredoxin subunit
MRRVRVCSESDLRDQRGLRVAVEGLEIAVFRRNGKVLAVKNVCAHQHFSVLHQGQLDGFTVTCPMHGWSYDLRTGKSTSGQGAVASYAACIEAGDVYIDIPDGP